MRAPLLLCLVASLVSSPAGAAEGGYPASGQAARDHAAHAAPGARGPARVHQPARARRKPVGHAGQSGHGRKGRHAATAGHGKSAGHGAHAAQGAAPHAPGAHAVHLPPPMGGPTPAESLQLLLAGNRRYLDSAFVHPAHLADRRAELAGGQRPFAVILGCADSRVPPEFVFDQGLGDLFVVRVAGNIPTPEVLGSIEYAVEHLGSSLVCVLGHERCGAVKAAVDGGTAPGHIGTLVAGIAPAVAEVRTQRPTTAGDMVDLAVRANVRRVTRELTGRSAILDAFVRAGRLGIVGARYDLDSGAVDLVP